MEIQVTWGILAGCTALAAILALLSQIGRAHV